MANLSHNSCVRIFVCTCLCVYIMEVSNNLWTITRIGAYLYNAGNGVHNLTAVASEAYHDWSGKAAGARLHVNFTLKLLLSQNFRNRPLMRFINFASNIGPAAAVPAGPAPAPLYREIHSLTTPAAGAVYLLHVHASALSRARKLPSPSHIKEQFLCWLRVFRAMVTLSLLC